MEDIEKKIKLLTKEQKATLLTNFSSLNQYDFEDVSIPHFRSENVDRILSNYKEDIIPDINFVASSFNENLLKEYGNVMSIQASRDGISLIDGININIAGIHENKFNYGISEDPYLVGKVVSYVISGIKANNVNVALNYTLMYENIDERIINEVYLRPYFVVNKENSIDFVKPIFASGKNNFDTKVYNDFKSYINNNDCLFIVNKELENPTYIHTVFDNEIVKNDLLSALSSYEFEKEKVANGEMSIDDLNKHIEENSIVSEIEINNSLNKLYSSVITKNKKVKSEITINKVAQFYYESIVLMKNKQHALPFTRGANVLLLAKKSYSTFLNADVVNSICDASKCESITLGRLEDSISPSKIKNIDYIVVILNTIVDNNLDKATLEALKKLKELNKKVIGILTSNQIIDLSFDRYLDAMLLAPIKSINGMKALFTILDGKFTPSGKLTLSYPNNYIDYSNDKKASYQKGLKEGLFNGYRYFDYLKSHTKYCFGHGLSYTKFEIDNVIYDDRKIKLTIKNVGKKNGSEVIQVYIGKNNRTVIKPIKELCGFKKVFLAPHEEKRVTIELDESIMRYYNTETKKFEIEGGVYSLYVGTSSNRILEEICFRANESSNLPSINEKINNYLNYKSNIVSGNYSLERKEEKPMRNIKKGLIIAFSVLTALCFDAAAAYLLIFVWNYKNPLDDIVVGSLALLVNALAIMFIIFACKNVKKNTNQALSNSDELQFDDEENDDNIYEELPYEQLFMDKKIKEIKVNNEQPLSNEAVDNDVDLSVYYDEKKNLMDYVSDLSNFIKEKGFDVKDELLRRIIAAMASSHMLIVKKDEANLVTSLFATINQYFGNDGVYDSLNSIVTDFSELIYDNDKETNFLHTLTNASKESEKISLAIIDNISFISIEAAMSNVIRYVNTNRSRVIAVNKEGEQISIGNNVFYILISSDDDISKLSSNTLRKAAYLKVDVNKVSPAEETSHLKWNYYQFVKNVEDLKAKYALSETHLAKLDLLENYVSGYTKFVIGNKITSDIEKYVGVLKTYEVEDVDVLDNVVATRILLLVKNALLNASNEDDPLDERLDKIFTADNLTNTLEINKLFIK